MIITMCNFFYIIFLYKIFFKFFLIQYLFQILQSCTNRPFSIKAILMLLYCSPLSNFGSRSDPSYSSISRCLDLYRTSVDLIKNVRYFKTTSTRYMEVIKMHIRIRLEELLIIERYSLDTENRLSWSSTIATHSHTKQTKHV